MTVTAINAPSRPKPTRLVTLSVAAATLAVLSGPYPSAAFQSTSLFPRGNSAIKHHPIPYRASSALSTGRGRPCRVRERRTSTSSNPRRGWASQRAAGEGLLRADEAAERDVRSRVYMVPEDKANTAEGWLPEKVQDKLTVINNDPDKLSLALNTIVVFLFAAFAAYKLATVDVDVSRGWTWYEILLRVPGDNFYRYEATVSENPIVTKALTSCVAYGLGDFTAQLFTGKDIETVDLWRTGRSATAGLLIHGPLCHYWIQLMQTYLDFNGAWWAFVPKVIADQTVWSIFLNAAYSTMIMSLQGMRPPEVWEQVKTTAWPALTSSWRFWPLIHCVSFSSIIPTDLKLLFIDCMEIIWVTILSTVANKDREGEGEGDEALAMAVNTGEMDAMPAPMVLEREAEPVHH